MPFSTPQPSAESRHVHTVSELTRRIKTTLESSYGRVWVSGELSNFKRHPSGHQYFSIKDAGAQLAAVLFAGIANRVRFQLKDGLEVVAFGLLTVFEQQGKYQIKVESIEPKGKGALQLAFEQLKEKLEREGLFDKARKRPIPVLPRRIGIVTSPSGAALRDILQILDRRFRELDILVAPARVQGEGSAQEVAEGIRLLNTMPDVDVLIVGRGGGSAEDLWAFNEEVVARAIAASRIPVISAVGHEIDVTIADLVADVRALTPSHAAETVVRPKAELLELLDAARRRLDGGHLERVRLLRARLDALRAGHALQRPLDRVAEASQRLDDLEERLRAALVRVGGVFRQRLDGVRTRLSAEAPAHRLALARAALSGARDRLAAGLSLDLRMGRERLSGLQARLAAGLPTLALARARKRLAELTARAEAAGRRRLDSAREAARAATGRLEGVSPLAVLARGYSVTRRAADGAVVRAPADVAPGEVLVTRVARGEVRSRVEPDGNL
ncbi:MAG: exodeoxyribonuclease VII large subunit [Planctomycetes bacterium]|nr:exodeoxyribonuclease VII large subunit [Planctomycetota bacterium]